MNKKQLLIIAINAILLTGSLGKICAKTDPTMEHTSDMNMEALIQEYVEENGALGAAVGLIDQGEIRLFCYGKKSIQNDELISEDTIFELGSITKVFTTLVLKDMVESGDVELDESIESYLPDIKIPEFEGKKITLRHLATHYSGLPALPDNFNPKNPMNPFKDYTVDDLYYFLSHHSLQRAPGESFEYSNVGMGLLGHILSKKANVKYEMLISKRICEKLGMKNTGITLSSEMEKHFATGYHQKEEIPYWNFSILAGAGAIRSNIKDMTQFLAASMGLLDSPLCELLNQCHKKQYLVGPTGDDIGLGWMISHSSTADVIWHNGGTGGFRTFLGFNPKTQKGIVVLSNSSECWPDAFSLSILDPDTHTKTTFNQTLAQDLDYLKQFEGAYESIINQQKVEFTIKITNGELIIAIPGAELKLLPESFGLFNLKGMIRQKIKFLFDDTGHIIKSQMMLSNGSIIAELLPKK